MVGRVKPELLVGRWCIALASLFIVHGIAHVSVAAEDETEGGGEADESSKKEATDEDDGKKDEQGDGDGQKKPEDDAFGHGGQVGLRLGVVGGYRIILRYEDSPLCREFDPAKGQNQPKFCGHVAPFALTTALSYGIADWLEPFAWGRFGLESEPETGTEPVLMFGAGVRVYTMSDAAFKIFIEPAIGLELEDGIQNDYDTDVALHLAAGPTLDLSRNVGIYATGGATTTIIRALSTSLDVELGIQGRY
jgi:hypothetical protein